MNEGKIHPGHRSRCRRGLLRGQTPVHPQRRQDFPRKSIEGHEDELSARSSSTSRGARQDRRDGFDRRAGQGMKVLDTGSPITVPVGPSTLAA